MFVEDQILFELYIFLVLELNANCASAANLHFEMHANEANMVPPCARRCSPCENKWCTIGRINLDIKEKAQGTPGITNLSLGDHHGYTDPHYHFKHRHGSTEVDAVAASLECND
jgi:hypothetical protein